MARGASRGTGGAIATTLLALATGFGCGSADGRADVPFIPDDAGGDGIAADAGPDATRPATVVEESFRAVFPYSKYSLPAAVDTTWIDPSTPETDPAASFGSLVTALDASVSCDLGCVPSPDGKWMAVVVAAPASALEGVTVRLYRLRAGPSLQTSGIADVPGVRAFAFGTDRFVFTRPILNCTPDQLQKRPCVTFLAIDLAPANPAGEQSLFTFPTADRLDDTLPPSGRFTIGQDGRTIIVLGPTVGSQSVWLWRGPTGLPILAAGPICSGRAPDGGCLESGSTFTDADPVALSPDGNHLVLALVEDDRALVLTHADLRDRVDGSGTPRTSVALLAMPDGISFAKDRCWNPPQSWQPTFVVSPIRFSPDGAEVVFVAGRECAPNAAKPWSNVLAVPLERVLRGGALARDDLRWITDFPQGDVAANVSIPADPVTPGATSDAMDLSPSGDYVVFSGTPLLDSSGQVISDSQDQHRTDREIWAARRDGTTAPVQLTARQGWKATSVRAIATPPAP